MAMLKRRTPKPVRGKSMFKPAWFERKFPEISRHAFGELGPGSRHLWTVAEKINEKNNLVQRRANQKLMEIGRRHSRTAAERLEKPVIDASSQYLPRLINEYAAYVGTQMTLAKMNVQKNRLELLENYRRIFERRMDKELGPNLFHLTTDPQTQKHVSAIRDILGDEQSQKLWTKCLRNHAMLTDELTSAVRQIQNEQQQQYAREEKRERSRQEKERKRLEKESKGRPRGL